MKKMIMFMALLMFILVGCSSNDDTNTGATNDDAASDFPSGSLQTIVPYSAGGGTDTFSRLVGKYMEEQFDESVVIENKPGASGEVGTTAMANAKPDGLNLGFISVLDYALIPTLKEATYNFDDFTYLASFTESGTVLVAGKNHDFQSLEDVVNYAKEHPGELSTSISGQGHTYVLMQLEQEAGIDIEPVMYSGGGESLNAVIGGHVDLAIISRKFVDQTEDQGLETLAISTKERLEGLDYVPTFIEEGYEVTSTDSRILLTPKETPDSIVKALEEQIDKVGANEQLAQDVFNAGFPYKYRSGEELQQFIESEISRVQEVVAGNEDVFLDN